MAQTGLRSAQPLTELDDWTYKLAFIYFFASKRFPFFSFFFFFFLPCAVLACALYRF